MHELELNADGSANMAYRKTAGVPWHGLGVPVSDDMTPYEMMKAAGVDWEVLKINTHYDFIHPSGEIEQMFTGRQALVRATDGKILSEVGVGWNPVQNAEAFDFFTDFVASGDMIMDTAGSLKEGRIIWALASIQDGFTLANGDQVNGYLLFSNPHMYGKSIDIKFVMIRVVCNNTLSVALTEKGQPAIRLNHRSEFNPDQVKEVLGIGHNHLESFRKDAELLSEKKYTKDQAKQYVEKLFGVTDEGEFRRTGEKVFQYIETSPGADLAPGSFWNLVNGVTYFTDHVQGHNRDNRLTSSWFGSNAKLKLNALELAKEMADG